ncbi:Oxygen regulatory protein NreC [compost metagenome]
MIKVGIIDSDEHSRVNIKRILIDNCLDGQPVPIDILFNSASSMLPMGSHPLRPDVIILDIQHQDATIIEKVSKMYPETEIIVLTQLADVKTVRRAFRNGAVSYVLKDTCLQYLFHAIIITLNHGSFVSPTINRALIEQAFSSKKYEDMLTARELQIANGIVEGLSYKLIAQQYHISLDTVRIYIKRVYRKLNINSKGELIAQLSA